MGFQEASKGSYMEKQPAGKKLWCQTTSRSKAGHRSGLASYSCWLSKIGL